MGQAKRYVSSKKRLAPITYCIVVEGEKTEKRYFDDLKAEFDQYRRHLKYRFKESLGLDIPDCHLVVKHAGGRSFENVLRKAIDEVDSGHSKIWCVVDADFYVSLQGKQLKDAEVAHRNAEKNNIEVILSRPCFEVWFRHHFNADTSAWVDGETAKANIQKIWPDYDLKPRRHWDLLRERLVDKAFDNAKLVRKHHGCPEKSVSECDASSEVDWIIYELFGEQDLDV